MRSTLDCPIRTARFTLGEYGVDVLDKKTGWKCDNHNGFFTTNIVSASLLRGIADKSTEKILSKAFLQVQRWEGPLTHDKRLTPLKHQPGAARFVLSRNNSYLGLRPGLGKTPIAAMIAATYNKPTVYITPPFLQLNVEEEFQKWAPQLFTKCLDNVDWQVPDVLVVPDSKINDPDVRKYIRFFKPQLLEIDEAHRFKEITTGRTKSLLGYHDKKERNAYMPGIVDGEFVKKVCYMSGTPMPSRPMELYSIVRKSAGQFIDFMNRDHFGMKYCAGFATRNEYTGQIYGYDYSGCNEAELKKLASKLVTRDPKNTTAFMLRMDKDTIDLPPLTEEIVVLGSDMPRELRKIDTDLFRMFSPEDLMKKAIALEQGKKDEESLHLASYRRLLGVHKAKAACEYLSSILDETDENVLVFGVHKEVIAVLAEKLQSFRPLVVTGDTPNRQRHAFVKEFQSSKKRRLFIGNIDAVGVGFTLTKANRACLVEWSWVPGVNRQAIDRAHRYSLQHPLLAQYLAFRNSLDRPMFESLNRKERVTNIV